jgi:hypothetical protein
MTLYEPATAITDLLLGVISFVLAVRLWRSAAAERSRRYWSGAIAASGLAALLGAFFHGAGAQVSRATLQATWKAVTMTVGLVSFCLITATAIASVRSPRLRRALRIAAAVQLVAYEVWMVKHDAFIFVIADYGIALLVVAGFQIQDRRHAPDSARPILAGIALSLIGAAIQASGFSLHQHFNHNDLYHVIQIVAMYLLYRGGRLLADR